MRTKKIQNGNSYVSYKWLLTTIIASCTGVLSIVGAIANATFYTKPAGAAIEQKIQATDKRLDEMNIMLSEVRQDVKLILAKRTK